MATQKLMHLSEADYVNLFGFLNDADIVAVASVRPVRLSSFDPTLLDHSPRISIQDK